MTDTASAYRVLARKYRPQNFDDLVGQEVLVRTLTNAFSSGRIAHAFLLTGIRGIGKTTTARIIARGLNCIGPDGNGQPTTTPCGVCPNCKMILDDRHVDVIEMDAASRTGVDDIREIIDTVQYAPTNARYKVYIIDEVHMLSKNAFNALLKTLEEPPAHVKFIFATTELRKIPITIVSRCQRFDLKRLTVDTLSTHLTNIAHKESITLDEESAKVVATAAEGSVRDGLSLLDQAIAMGTDSSGAVTITADGIRDMLGLADKTQGFTLFEHVFAGKAKEAVDQLHAMHQGGSDAVLLLQDLLSLVHFITRVKMDTALAVNAHYGEEEQARAKAMADGLGMGTLARSWQMLLKGISEAKIAPQPLAAAEMILVRLAYAADMPPPGDLVKIMKNGAAASSAAPVSAPSAAPAMSTPAPAMAHATMPTSSASHSAPVATSGNLALAVAHDPEEEERAAPVPELLTHPKPEETITLETLRDVVELLAERKEMVLCGVITHDVKPVSIEPGQLVMKPLAHIEPDIPARLGRFLTDVTGQPWRVRLDAQAEASGPSLHEENEIEKRKVREYVASTPLVHAALEAFPGAEILEIEETK